MGPSNSKHKAPDESDTALSEQAAAWFARLHSDEVSEREQADFSRWLEQSPRHRRAYDEVAKILNDPAFSSAIIDSVRADRKSYRRIRYLQVSLGLAASFALFVVLANDPLIRWQADFRTNTGERRSVQLADGSEITLNTDSAIAVDLQPEQRRVRLLKGEALFRVHADAQRPFIVDSGGTLTRVLGTRFLVRDDGSTDRVTVIEGVVAVKPAAEAGSLTLQRQQQTTVRNGMTEGITRVALAQETAWLQGRLVFRDAPVPEVVRELNRYLPGRLILLDKNLEDHTLNARFDITRPDAVLESLSQTLPVKIIRLGPWLTLIRSV